MVVDIIVAIILLGSAIISFLRGFIREILTIFGIVGGVVAAYIGGPIMIPIMSGWLGIVEGEEPKKLFDVIPYPMLSQVLSYGIVFLGFAIILSIISHLISEGASKIGLGALDRTLGFVFGLARGLLVLGMLYLPFMSFTEQENRDKWFAESKTHPYIEATSLWLAQFVPKEATEKMQQTVEKAQQTNETRKKLESMGMLPEQQSAEDQGQQSKELRPAEGENSGTNGYPPEFREKLNQLIDKATQQPPEQSLEKTPAQTTQDGQTQNQ